MPRAPSSPYCYRAFGCNLVSDIALPRLHVGADPALDTIIVSSQDDLPEPPDTAIHKGTIVRAAPNFLSIDIEGIVKMVAQDGQRVLYRAYRGADVATVQVYLMGSGLGAVLMQRKLLVLHGNAVEVEGGCVICLGPSGAGKSTTAAGLMTRGYRVMSDDVCAVNAACEVVPGIPHIRLWQVAADRLGLSTDGLSAAGAGSEKYEVPLAEAFCSDSLPVTRLYLLSPEEADTVTLERLNATEKFRVLRDNSYRFPFVAGMGMADLHFQQVVALLKRASVTVIRRPAQGFHLEELLDALIADATGPDRPASGEALDGIFTTS